METRSIKIANILRFIGIVVTVGSLILNFWLFREKDQLEQSSEAVILHQIGVIADLTRELKQANKLLDIAALQRDSLLAQASQESLIRDSLLQEVSYLQYIIEKLKLELDENITIPDMSDDEHIQLFLEWTKLEQ